MSSLIEARKALAVALTDIGFGIDVYPYEPETFSTPCITIAPHPDRYLDATDTAFGEYEATYRVRIIIGKSSALTLADQADHVIATLITGLPGYAVTAVSEPYTLTVSPTVMHPAIDLTVQTSITF